MGTNFYTLRGKHIGKRSAAGYFCWKCMKTLCVGGIKQIHTGKGKWYDRCPNCGTEITKESLEDSTVGRELGFNKSRPGKKQEVSTCSSFSWGINKKELKRIKKVKNEYGEILTIAEFNEILEECPIQFEDLIGVDFS